MQKKITRWRQEHEDWEALAAFAVSKTTGRRFKHRLHRDSNSAVASGSTETETTVSPNNSRDVTAVNLSNTVQGDVKMLDSDSVTFVDENRQTSSNDSKSLRNKLVQNKPRRSEQVTECSRMKEPSVGSPSVSWFDAVVRQISLDELSDEELFLPPPDDEDETLASTQAAAIPSKIASGFFVVSDEEDLGDNNFSANKAPAQTTASLSSDTDESGDAAASASELRNSVKFSTMFARSLSQRRSYNAVVNPSGRDKKAKSSSRQNQQQRAKENKRSGGKRFSDKPFMKSRGSFPNSRGGHYPQSDKKYSRGDTMMSKKYVELASVRFSYMGIIIVFLFHL